LKNNLIANEVLCCIGNTTADGARKKTKSNKIIIAKEPTPEAMLEKLTNYFDSRLTTYNQ